MRVTVVIVLCHLLAACATTAQIRVPVGQVASWTFHPPAPCEPTWSTTRPAVAHVSADADAPFTVTVLGRTAGKAQVRVVCGGVTYAEAVEVFRVR